MRCQRVLGTIERWDCIAIAFVSSLLGWYLEAVSKQTAASQNTVLIKRSVVMQGCTCKRALRSDCLGCVEGDMSRSECGTPVLTTQGALPVCSYAACWWKLVSIPRVGAEKQGGLEHLCTSLCSQTVAHSGCVLAPLDVSSARRESVTRVQAGCEIQHYPRATAPSTQIVHAQVRVHGIMLSMKNLFFCSPYCLLSGKIVLGD